MIAPVNTPDAPAVDLPDLSPETRDARLDEILRETPVVPATPVPVPSPCTGERRRADYVPGFAGALYASLTEYVDGSVRMVVVGTPACAELTLPADAVVRLRQFLNGVAV